MIKEDLDTAAPKPPAAQKPSSDEKSRGPPQFIPKLKDKRVVIRLISGGQGLTGTIVAYNPYEIMIQTSKGQVVVFKHAIAAIEVQERQA